MAIKFFTDKIQIGDYNLFEGNGGIQFDGVARAENFLVRSPAQGSRSGYSAGGYAPPPVGYNKVIDKFPFATDTNATNVGNLSSTGGYGNAGQSSATHGYNSGGRVTPGVSNSNFIDKFPFAIDTDATDIADLSRSVNRVTGHSSSTHGYTSGGFPAANNIDKFTFSADANATDVGDLVSSRSNHAGQSSFVSGYASSGDLGPPTSPVATNSIDKFPFATDTNATDIGDLTVARRGNSGQSSSTHGYTSGGSSVNTIDKFPFATNTNATDVGDLVVAADPRQSQSSTTHGYVSDMPTSPSSSIQKFSFTTDSNASNVGNKTVTRGGGGGQQV